MSLVHRSFVRAIVAFLFSLALALFSVTYLIMSPYFYDDDVRAQEPPEEEGATLGSTTLGSTPAEDDLSGLSEEEKKELMTALEAAKPAPKPRPKPAPLPSPSPPAAAPSPPVVPLSPGPSSPPSSAPSITAIPVPVPMQPVAPSPAPSVVPSPAPMGSPLPPSPTLQGTERPVPSIPTPLLQPGVTPPGATGISSPPLATPSPPACPPSPSTPLMVQEKTGPVQLGPLVSGKLEVEKIRFEFATLNMTPRSQEVLKELASKISGDPSIQGLRVEVHTDSVGSDQANLFISQSRAKAVRDFLIAQGVEGGKIEAVGKGDKFPLVSNATYEGQETNRRIEFYLVK